MGPRKGDAWESVATAPESPVAVFAWLNAATRATIDGVAVSSRLKPPETPAPTVAAAPLTADLEELDRLRADVTEVRKQLAAVVGYWFAWYAFNPATEVFRAGEASKPR